MLNAGVISGVMGRRSGVNVELNDPVSIAPAAVVVAIRVGTVVEAWVWLLKGETEEVVAADWEEAVDECVDPVSVAVLSGPEAEFDIESVVGEAEEDVVGVLSSRR